MPYKSRAQAGYMHAAAERGDIDPDVVEKFDRESKGQHDLPYKVKKNMGHDCEYDDSTDSYPGGPNGPAYPKKKKVKKSLVLVIPLEKALPGRMESGHKTAPKGYPEERKEYADSANFKYPLDSEEHVRSAMSYISMPKNQMSYSPSQVRSMKARIKHAGKKYGIHFQE